jgi:hypothetical protein
VPGFADGSSAVVAFTAHSVVATHRDASEFVGVPLDGYGGTLSPVTLLRLAGTDTIGVIDVTMVARGRGGPSGLTRTDRWDDHYRVAYARVRRSDVRVFGDERGLVTIGSGLAGRLEMSVEVVEPLHSSGAGRVLIGEALRLVPGGELLFAAVSPGNARSLRAFLSQGFVPIGSEVHITPPHLPGPSEHHRDAGSKFA